METATSEAVYRFEGFVLDLVRGALLNAKGEEIPLRRKSFELLRLFVENAGRLLDRDRINRAIWSDVIVTDDSITQCIRDIRRALGDDAQRILKTVPRRGFIFAAEAIATRPAPPSTDRLISVAERPPLPLPDKPSLVVLPFQNMSGDPAQEYFADGMVEEITTGLARIRSLFVIARNSAFTYKGRAVDVRQVGRELGVRYVLEGSVRKAGSRVRITGQLVDAETGAHLWADRFDGMLADVFQLQDHITASVVGAIEPNVRMAEIQRAQRKPAEDLQAYDIMLRALPHVFIGTRDEMAEAARLLRSAVEIDVTYAPSFAYLAICQLAMVSQGWMDRGNPAVAEMIHLAQTALALDDNDPEVLRIADMITALPGGDLNGGIALIDRSISFNANNASALVDAGFLHVYAGDTASAISHLNRSGRLNPCNRPPYFYLCYALAHFVAGEYEAAVEWTGKGLQLRPNSTPLLRYRAANFGLLGRLDEGRQVVQRLLALVPDFTIRRARRHIEFDLNNIFKTPSVADSFYEGLRRSGVPE